jgi:hypothetical protein
MRPTDLEREVDRALRQLPVPRAPRTLAPRVMQAIALQAQAAADLLGWRRWPLAVQMLALVVACSIAAVIVVAVPLASSYLAATDTVKGAVAFWRMFIAPLVTPAMVAMSVMCTLSALLLAGLKHIAWEGQWKTN